MLPLPSGSDIALRSYEFELTDSSHVGEVRRFAAQVTTLLGFTEERASRVAIIINELGSNLSRHAVNGRILIQASLSNDVKSLQIFAIDSGPGIPNLSHAMEDGVTSGGTPGTGLGAIARQADEFAIDTNSKGTVLYATVHATNREEILKKPCFAIAAICSPIAGERVCGDAWYQIRNNDVHLILVADGLGHGPNAHKASSTAVDVFSEMDPALPLEVMMKRIHEVLRSTRGAAVSLLRYNPVAQTVETFGVGNVRVALLDFPRDKTLITHSGTVGLQYRNATASTTSWNGSGYLVLHSDGLQTKWSLASLDFPKDLHPALLAATLYRDQNRGTDDTTVLVGGFFSEA